MTYKVSHRGFISNVIYLVFFLQFHIILDSKNVEDFIEPKQQQVVVRAVFINCETNEDQAIYPNNEASRFQREELYKHSALQSCRKKLAVTLKVSNEPQETSGDEYIPIEHVFDGPNKKRVRLLNPYILRIRRESPLQAYKLRLMDTVTGIIEQSDDRKSTKTKKVRVQSKSEKLSDDKKDLAISEYFSSTKQTKKPCGWYQNTVTNSSEGSDISQSGGAVAPDSKYDQPVDGFQLLTAPLSGFENKRVKKDVCTANSPAWRRDKRNEHNIIVEDGIEDGKIPWETKERFYKSHSHVSDLGETVNDDKPTDNNHYSKKRKIETKIQPDPTEIRNIKKNMHYSTSSKEHDTARDHKPLRDNVITTMKIASSADSGEERITRRYIEEDPLKNPSSNYEASYALYEIAQPELWYSIQVQLFEKMSTSEGKTVWNDITNGEIASVSTIEPEWKGQDVNVKYRPTEWVSKNKFSLSSSTSLGLLVSLHDEGAKGSDEDNGALRKFIVVPMDDIVNLEHDNPPGKRDGNLSDYSTDSSQRRVLVRVSRALLTGREDDMKISSLGSNHFLLMPYRSLHQAQIDIEARADDNELIRVGSSGSLITMVADNSRRIRSTIIVQATNKGLAAARFKVKVRDCGPELNDFMAKSGDQLTTDPVLVAPRHTHRFTLELPKEIPLDFAHCSVALINDEDETVAVREVTIKKGDRCFCVWHCDCVCLNEDPKLLCREMAEVRQTAAGLSPRGRPRRARFACYPDVLCVNISVVVVGVLLALLMLGLLKAVLGVFCHCVGKWGLYRLIQTPRKLNQYYEWCLRERPVICDNEGWPVHPDTLKRTVRLVSKEMEFALNIIFFIAIPSLMLWDAIKWIGCAPNKAKTDARRACEDTKKCFSTHDLQGKPRRWHRRRVGLHEWMTKPAEELTTDIWDRGFNILRPVECEFMLPLLAERQYRADDISSCIDSEQDDTEYVLTQMQKSKESLAKSQRKLNESGPSTTVTKHLNGATDQHHSP